MTVALDQSKTLSGGLPYLGSFAYANLPLASSWSGYTAVASDLGVGPGLMLVSDGTRWIALGEQVLARSAVQASVTGTLSETTLASIALPAGILGVNGGLQVVSSWSVTNSANTKTVKVRFNDGGATAFMSAGLTTTTTWHDLRRLRNRNSAASQVASTAVAAATPIGSTGGAITTAAVDTTVALALLLTATLTNVGETIALESYEVWLLP